MPPGMTEPKPRPFIIPEGMKVTIVENQAKPSKMSGESTYSVKIVEVENVEQFSSDDEQLVDKVPRWRQRSNSFVFIKGPIKLISGPVI